MIAPESAMFSFFARREIKCDFTLVWNCATVIPVRRTVDSTWKPAVFVGANVGANVGDAVGTCVGECVGACVGACVKTISMRGVVLVSGVDAIELGVKRTSELVLTWKFATVVPEAGFADGATQFVPSNGHVIATALFARTKSSRPTTRSF